MSESLATANIAAQYEIAERRRRVYTGLLLILLVLMLIGGVRIAEDANSGSLLAGFAKGFRLPL